MTTLLALGFSPRKNGNSDLLLKAFIDGAKEAGAEVETVYPRRIKIHACLECGGCNEAGVCVLQDGMEALYPSLIEAERVVVATPVFFFGVPSQAKALVDRCQALWSRTRLFPELKRPSGRGFFIGVGGSKGKNVFTGTDLCVQYFFDAIGLPKGMGQLVYSRVEAKGSIREHPTALAEAREAGRLFMN
jgi:multimeric flavodoxin WrbA